MRIGILSFAHHHADGYISGLHTLPGVELMGVADEVPARAKQMAAKYSVPAFRTYEALLAAKPDGVLVCSENSKHRPLVEMAAGSGVHVLCEKPLATSVHDAHSMVDTCHRAGVILMTAFPMRFSPPVVEIRTRLQAGDFGQVYAFNAVNQGEMPRKYREWFVDRTLAGGGAVADHTVHVVDLLRWYLDSELDEIYCQANRIFHADTVSVETGALELMTFENGVFATLDASWSRPDYWPTWGGLGFEMVTERGAVLVDAFRQNIVVYSHQLQRPDWRFWGSDMNRAMIEEFINAIRQGREPLVTGVDGLRAVEAVEAAYRSEQSGQPVKVIKYG